MQYITWYRELHSFVSTHENSLEVIETASEEVLERVRGEFGLNELRVREPVEHLKE